LSLYLGLTKYDRLMAKIYSKKNTFSNDFKPQIETINFLLNYSKAFKVSVYNGLKFETIIN